MPKINRYGILMAFPSYSRSAHTATIQVQAYNGSTGNFYFDGERFKLIDREGNEYKPASKIGAFSKTKLIEPGQETEVGQLRFNVPKDAEVSHLQFTSDAGLSEKFLP